MFHQLEIRKPHNQHLPVERPGNVATTTYYIDLTDIVMIEVEKRPDDLKIRLYRSGVETPELIVFYYSTDLEARKIQSLVDAWHVACAGDE